MASVAPDQTTAYLVAVAFVLSILVINNDDHATGTEFLKRFGNFDEWRLGTHDGLILARCGASSREL